MKPLLRWTGVSAAAFLALAASRSSAADAAKFRPLSFQTLSLEKARTFGADFFVDNHDRDPQGIDVFDTGFRFRYQAGDRTEIFASAVVDRVVALPETPAIPQSPRDLIFVGSIRPIPNSFNGEHPYLDHRGEASFDAFIPGTATVGFTRSFGDPSYGAVFGFSSAVVIPMSGSLNALRSGASSGRPDAWFAALGTTEVLGGRVHGRAAFTLTGKGSWPDHSFSVSGNTFQEVVTKTPIGNRMDVAAAWIRPVTETLALTAEARLIKEFVGEERIDAISPVDVVVGIQKAFGRWTIAASVLDHFRSLPSGERRANPLAGGIDLSDVSVVDRNAFLTRSGLAPVIGALREGAHIVVVGSNATSLPPGAVRINPTYNIRSEHNLGYIFTLTFRP